MICTNKCAYSKNLYIYIDIYTYTYKYPIQRYININQTIWIRDKYTYYLQHLTFWLGARDPSVPERLNTWTKNLRSFKVWNPGGIRWGRNFPHPHPPFSSRFKTWKSLPPGSLTARPWKWMVGRWVSFWDSLFSGAMLNFGRVNISLFSCSRILIFKMDMFFLLFFFSQGPRVSGWFENTYGRDAYEGKAIWMV